MGDGPLTNRKSTPRFLRYKHLSFDEKKKLRALITEHTQAGACKVLKIGRETLLEALAGTLGDATYIRVQKAIRDAVLPEAAESGTSLVEQVKDMA